MLYPLNTAVALLLSGEALESFRNNEKRRYSEYKEMQKVFGFCVIEGDELIEVKNDAE